MKNPEVKSPRYITDNSGKKISVVLSLTTYKKMLAELEELEDIRMYDDVKSRKEKSIPFSQYLRRRQKKNA